MSSPLSESGKTIDCFILYACRHKLFWDNQVFYNNPTLRIGRFRMGWHDHATGNHVFVTVIKDDKTEYEIINGNYWFHSRYCFNKFKWETGAWDNALKEAFETLKSAVHKHQGEVAGAIEKEKEEKAVEFNKEKREVEKLFVWPPLNKNAWI